MNLLMPVQAAMHAHPDTSERRVVMNRHMRLGMYLMNRDERLNLLNVYPGMDIPDKTG